MKVEIKIWMGRKKKKNQESREKNIAFLLLKEKYFTC